MPLNRAGVGSVETIVTLPRPTLLLLAALLAAAFADPARPGEVAKATFAVG